MREPTIIIPYKGPNCTGLINDIFLYLRPETNGILVESLLMGVLRGTPLYRDNAELVYMANLPGDFIMRNHVIEDHYSINYKFACIGKVLFTDNMKKKFEEKFSVSYENAEILGSFEALEELEMTADELFKVWVPDQDMIIINGQSIKKINELYIINYDLPALLHKTNFSTDIAVMILRTSLKKEHFHQMIRSMESVLVEKGLMDKNKPPSRYFHYSKGPFEQILDGRGYLYNEDGTHLSIKTVSFAERLLKYGFSIEEINGVIKNPIMIFKDKIGLVEDNIFNRTNSKSFEEALDVLNSARSQIYIDKNCGIL